MSNKSRNYIHNNLNVWKELNNCNADVIITTSFNPTMFYAFLWCILNRKKHISFTDGTLRSEQDLSFFHVLARRITYFFTKSFIGPSNSSVDNYRKYDIPIEKIFKSPLAVNNDSFVKLPFNEKTYDLMFSGQFIDRKLPFFFIEVAKRVKNTIGRCKILILGGGELEVEMMQLLDKYSLDYDYPGFIDQLILPQYYAKVKVFLFPTKVDPWGIVVNEAMASGVPVITCESAGVAHELVVDNENGYVLTLNEDIWAEQAIKLISDLNLYEKFSSNALAAVKQYNFASAASGIVDAVNYALVKNS